MSRLRCEVPFCKRTRGRRKGDAADPDPAHEQWICGDHWRRVSPHLRRRKARLERLYRRRFGDASFWTFPGGSPKRIAAVKLDRLCRLAWERCRRQAIEHAAGI
jgi:hypothetical protein